LITRLKLFGYSGYKVLTKKEDIIDLYCQWKDCPTMQFDDLAVNTFFSLLKNVRWLRRTEPDYSGIFDTKKSVSYKSTRYTQVTGIFTVGKILHT